MRSKLTGILYSTLPHLETESAAQSSFNFDLSFVVEVFDAACLSISKQLFRQTPSPELSASYIPLRCRHISNILPLRSITFFIVFCPMIHIINHVITSARAANLYPSACTKRSAVMIYVRHTLHISPRNRIFRFISGYRPIKMVNNFFGAYDLGCYAWASAGCFSPVQLL